MSREDSLFEVEIEGFSGPLDLLCHMVESREIEASKVRVSEIVRVYGAYLFNSRKAPIGIIAQFISTAASLVLEKALALLPRVEDSEGQVDEENTVDEPDIESLLVRYRPYRKASVKLSELQEDRQRCFLREGNEPPPSYDLGDLYSLSLIWLELIRGKCKKEEDFDFVDGDDAYLEGLPAPIPDEIQVEARMQEIMAELEGKSFLNIGRFIDAETSVSLVVVTLLALLEMSRRNKIVLRQEIAFGDIFIAGKGDEV